MRFQKNSLTEDLNISSRIVSKLLFSNKNNILDLCNKNWIIVELVEVTVVIRKALLADEEQVYNYLILLSGKFKTN